MSGDSRVVSVSHLKANLRVYFGDAGLWCRLMGIHRGWEAGLVSSVSAPAELIVFTILMFPAQYLPGAARVFLGRAGRAGCTRHSGH